MVINLDPVARTRLNSRRDLGTFASDRKIDGQAFGSESSGLMSKLFVCVCVCVCVCSAFFKYFLK